MIRTLTAIALIAAFLTPTGDAATPTHSNRSNVYKAAKRPGNPPKVQQFHSFIPPSQPSATITRLQTQLTGRVVEEAQTPAIAPQPRYVQIFFTSEEQAALEALTSPKTKPALTVRHPTQQKRHLASKRPKKLRVQPEVLTPANSYVVPLTSADAGQLSTLIASFIQEQIPDTQTSLFLTDVPVSQTGNMLTLNLQHTLKTMGYTVSQTPKNNPVTIRYRVSNLDKTLLVRVKVNGVETAQLYERSYSGVLAAASPTSRINRSEP